MTTYRIRDWSKHFENNRTRELKELRFVILPNKHDGDGYTELLDHPNGAAHYGAWVSLVQVSSKGKHPAEDCENPAGCCECRGRLLRTGARPHDPVSLSRLTRISASVYEEVLPRLVKMEWLDSSELEIQENQRHSGIPHPPAVPSPSLSRTPLRKSAISIEEKGMEGNGREQKGTEEMARTARPRSPSKPTGCDEEYLTELQTDEAYQKLNVKQVHAKMVRWCKEKRKQPTRLRLINWLNREDLPMEESGGTDNQNARNGRGSTGDFEFKPKSIIR